MSIRSACLATADGPGPTGRTPEPPADAGTGAAEDLVAGVLIGQRYRLEERGPQPVAWVAQIVADLVEALDVAHAHGIWHRDVKPSNVLLAPRGGGVVAKLADFGVAKATGTSLDAEVPRGTTAGVLVGTPAYLSPEQVRGEAPGPSGDLWAVAVLAYEAFTGRAAFDADTVGALLVRICTETPIPPSRLVRVPRAVDEWLERALAKSAADRFASGRDMVATLRTAPAGTPSRCTGRSRPAFPGSSCAWWAVIPHVPRSGSTASSWHRICSASPSSATSARAS